MRDQPTVLQSNRLGINEAADVYPSAADSRTATVSRKKHLDCNIDSPAANQCLAVLPMWQVPCSSPVMPKEFVT